MNPWVLAIRPKTLPAAIAPVVIGTAMAFGDGIFHAPSALMALLAALCIQIGTNLANDYFDFIKGADTTERTGPLRVTQSGLIDPDHVRWGFISSFSLAVISSAYLVGKGGWPIVLIGTLSILCGILYTAGRYALGYLGLGDIFVFIFFGPIAVLGTYYLQTLQFHLLPLIAGIGPGLISTAILTVNNLRQNPSDRKAGKNTLAVRFSASFVRYEYLLCLITAGMIPAILFSRGRKYVNWPSPTAA